MGAPRSTVTVACLGLIACAAAAQAGGPAASAQTGAPSAREAFAAANSRIISARFFHTRISTVRNSNAGKVGRALGSLQPTWVTGLLRYARHQYPSRAEVRAWNKIRRKVRARSPGAHFDVVLNADHYRTPAAIRLTMRRLRTKLGNEGWFFDFLSGSFRRNPKMVRAAISSAHKHGEWIGGNVFGIASNRPLPSRVDFLSVQDHVFHLNLGAVRRLATGQRVIYHLNSDPAKAHSGSCRFIQRLNTRQRLGLVRRRAAQQPRVGFRFSYPVLFPQCVRPRKGGGSFLAAYNAFRDPPMAREIGRLLDLYDFVPGRD
jgi:hypothetical protein